MGDSRVVVYPSNSSSSKYVKLNVGGTLHYTTIGTLTKHDNMLRAMFSGRMEVLTDSEGTVWACVLFLVYILLILLVLYPQYHVLECY